MFMRLVTMLRLITPESHPPPLSASASSSSSPSPSFLFRLHEDFPAWVRPSNHQGKSRQIKPSKGTSSHIKAEVFLHDHAHTLVAPACRNVWRSRHAGILANSQHRPVVTGLKHH